MGTTGEDAETWADRGLALVAEGDLDEAERALRHAAALRPDDGAILADLAHVEYVRGNRDDATTLLARAVALAPDDLSALRSLIDMHRVAGNTGAALEFAEQLVERRGGDVLGLVDVATLRLETGRFKEADEAFRELRALLEEPQHLTFAYHGMIEAHIRRGEWRRAMDDAIAATAVDRHQLTTDLLAFIAAKLFGRMEHDVPAWEELAARLEEERAARRRELVEMTAL